VATENEKLNEELEAEIAAAFGDMSAEEMMMASADAAGPKVAGEAGRVHGRIIGVRGEDVFVALGGKAEGVLPLSEFPEDAPPDAGQEMDFVNHGPDPASGMLRLSLREVLLDASWDSLRRGEVVEAKVTGVNKGGLSMDLNGMRAFMPAGQVDIDRIDDLSTLIGRKLECEVTEVNRSDRNITLSRRRLLEKQRAEAREQLKYTLAEGQVLRGVVRRLADFGAFVDIGGIDGLLHISEMSYGRLGHPSEMLKVGETIDVSILKIDLVKDRISLGLKQLTADPWTLAPAKYSAGDVVSGRVVKLMPFGAFVEVEPGVEGLIPISEMTYTRRVGHPKEVLKENDQVQVKVLSMDAENHKMSLSLKQLGDDPWTTVVERYTPQETVTGRVCRLTDFGAFVELEEGVDGLVHISELSDQRVPNVSSVVKEGQIVQVRVLSVDAEQRRISLSMRSGQPVQQAGEQAQSGGDQEGGSGDRRDPRPPMQQPEPRQEKKRKRPLRGGLE
jgi:small subunit ribosomal protein S1